jgi:hypothetical protein
MKGAQESAAGKVPEALIYLKLCDKDSEEIQGYQENWKVSWKEWKETAVHSGRS